MGSYRIKSKFRFTIFLTIMLMLLIYIISSFLGLSKVNGQSQMEFDTVTVHAGDTLWTIAQQYTAEDEDVRETVYHICKVNKISSTDISVGQKLKIPLEAA